MFKKISILLMLVVLATGILMGFQTMRPPSPPSQSDPDYAAYQRMLANLEAMTMAPHPSGTREIEAVRSYLLAQIHDMGLEATVASETFTVMDVAADTLARQNANQSVLKKKPQRRARSELPPSNESVSSPPVVTVEDIAADIRRGANFNENDEIILKNILVKLDAPGTDRGILMLAHYDSENNTPGTADDMISVCALLEALREQARNTNLQNDLYFLFTDGEELGALGAKAFVGSHPDLQDTIDLVINFEARGNRGGLIMFETSTHNYDLLHYFQSASSRPLAFSYTTALYRQMPNGTDLTDFLDAGYSGLNFAVAEGVEHYHEPSDSFENLDRGTAYNFLQTALEVAEYGAQVRFRDSSSNQDSVYFPLLPGQLVVMSSVTAYLLSGVAALFALVWLILQIRHGRIKLRHITGGTGWLLGSMAVTALLSWGIITLLTQRMRLDESTNNDRVFLGQILVLGVSVLALFIFRLRRLSLPEAVAGLLPLQLLLIIGTTVFFNTISYLFTLPTLGILIVAILERNRIGRLLVSTVLGTGILLLYVPTCWLIYVLFMLPVTPAVVALSVIPVSMIAAFFTTKYEFPLLPIT